MDKNQQKRKEISEFSEKLRLLAESAPDGYARKDLYRSLHFLRQRYSSPEKKKLEILAKIIDGASTFAELLIETGLRLVYCRTRGNEHPGSRSAAHPASDRSGPGDFISGL